MQSSPRWRDEIRSIGATRSSVADACGGPARRRHEPDASRSDAAAPSSRRAARQRRVLIRRWAGLVVLAGIVAAAAWASLVSVDRSAIRVASRAPIDVAARDDDGDRAGRARRRAARRARRSPRRRRLRRSDARVRRVRRSPPPDRLSLTVTMRSTRRWMRSNVIVSGSGLPPRPSASVAPGTISTSRPARTLVLKRARRLRFDADDRAAGAIALAAAATPLISPPPPIGTTSVSRAGRILEHLRARRSPRRRSRPRRCRAR